VIVSSAVVERCHVVAVIVAVSAISVVTSPSVSALAADGLLLRQRTRSPVSGAPAASLTLAVYRTTLRTTIVSVAGEMVMDAAGGVTVIVVTAFLPPALAVIVVDPGAAPVTRPFGVTVAMDGFELDQVIVAPGTKPPLASFALAVTCSVSPTCTAADTMLSVTAATCGCGAVDCPPHDVNRPTTPTMPPTAQRDFTKRDTRTV